MTANNSVRNRLVILLMLSMLITLLCGGAASASSTVNISNGLNEEFRSVLLVDNGSKYLSITKTQESINGSNQNVSKVMLRDVSDSATWTELYRAFGSNSDIRSIQRIPGTQKFFMVEQRGLSVVNGLTKNDFDNRTSLLGGTVTGTVNIEGGMALSENEFFVLVNNAGVHWKKDAGNFVNISGNLPMNSSQVQAKWLFIQDNNVYVTVQKHGLYKLDTINGASSIWSPVGNLSSLLNDTEKEVRAIYFDSNLKLIGVKNGIFIGQENGNWLRILTDGSDNHIEGFLLKEDTIYAYGKNGIYQSPINSIVAGSFTRMPEWTSSTHIRTAILHNGNMIIGYGSSNTGALQRINLSVPQVVATPTATPAAGQVSSGTLVTLNTETGGASIYYTLDGSTPTTSSTPYTGPIVINNSTTIKAIAVKTGMSDSDVMTAIYTITPQAPIPPADPQDPGELAGDVDGDGSVTLDDARLVIDFYLGKSAPTASQALAADVNKDGKITPADALLIAISLPSFR